MLRTHLLLTWLHRIITERILLVIMIVLLGHSRRISHRLRVIIVEATLGTQLIVIVVQIHVILVTDDVVIESLMQLLDLILFYLQDYFVFAVDFGYLLFYNLAVCVVIRIILVRIEASLCESATSDRVFSNI